MWKLAGLFGQAAKWFFKSPIKNTFGVAAKGATGVTALSVADELALDGKGAAVIKDATGVDLSPSGLMEIAGNGVTVAVEKGGELAANAAEKAAEKAMAKAQEAATQMLQGDTSALKMGIPALLGTLTFLYQAFGKGHSWGGSALGAGLMLTAAVVAMQYASKNGWLDSVNDFIKSTGLLGSQEQTAPVLTGPEPGM
ncbi:MAG: hypothetical protein LRZ85_02710 [Alphaproteobacteria bacterium]|nr:hypothetical protein [Alphaproteobacteria bacterium]MCD8525666.1 hypothetical protein [Alphaproteobacteria bacterium]MCD8570179.1 hypothetical protein [Alphaproteobacteria bacterium]